MPVSDSTRGRLFRRSATPRDPPHPGGNHAKECYTISRGKYLSRRVVKLTGEDGTVASSKQKWCNGSGRFVLFLVFVYCFAILVLLGDFGIMKYDSTKILGNDPASWNLTSHETNSNASKAEADVGTKIDRNIEIAAKNVTTPTSPARKPSGMQVVVANSETMSIKKKHETTAISPARKPMGIQMVVANSETTGIEETTKAISPPHAPSGKCRQVYLWGGGKSGSSTLWWKMVGHETENGGPYVDASGEEACIGTSLWEKWVDATKNEQLCDEKHAKNAIATGKRAPTHILNGCPRHTSLRQAKAMMDLENRESGQHSTFLVLIRDPVDRLVSHLNDNVRRGRQRIDIEQVAKNMAKRRPIKGLEGTLSYQGAALKNLFSFVKNPSRILIIPTESLKKDFQGVLNAMMDHVGGEKFKFNPMGGTHVNQGTEGGHKYVKLTNQTRDELRDVFRDDVLLLESLVGRRFSWSSWAREFTVEEKEDSGWLVTTPKQVL